MTAYEYTVVPAPTKGLKARGVKTPEARFAYAFQDLMNKMGADGWEYQRAETLPSVERSGLTSSTTNWRHILVFRRVKVTDAESVAVAPAQITHAPEAVFAAAAVAAPVAAAAPANAVAPETSDTLVLAPEMEAEADIVGDIDPDRPAGQRGATHMMYDDGVEETSDVAGMTSSLERLAQARKREPSDI